MTCRACHKRIFLHEACTLVYGEPAHSTCARDPRSKALHAATDRYTFHAICGWGLGPVTYEGVRYVTCSYCLEIGRRKHPREGIHGGTATTDELPSGILE